MPADLRALYAARADWNRTLANFRAWRGIWKASVLNDIEDEQASDIAESCWQQLRRLKTKVAKLHGELGFAASENEPFELPWDEYREQVSPEVQAIAPVRMDDGMKALLELGEQ